MPIRGVINLEIGEEVLLYIIGSKPLLKTLARMNPLHLRLNAGVARNEFGPLGFLLFWVPFNTSRENAVAVFDLYVNISNEPLMRMWMELAHQTHWHVFLLDEKNKQHGFWEFPNTFRLESVLNEIDVYCRGLPLVDFDRSKEKFISESSLEGLHAMTLRSETNADGVSVFDVTNAVPSPPEYPNPLKTARFGGVIRESLAYHSKSDSLNASNYAMNKIDELASMLASRKLIYLDVCHWINLRHVWLQSPKSLPVYEKIVKRLNALAEKQEIICPLSAPIFEELMKQTDSFSRAATANLMEIFSRGICVHTFKDALCEQWRNFLLGELKSEKRSFGSLTKIGFWLPTTTLRQIFHSPEIESVWEKVCIDLRWNVTLDDYQRLAVLGSVARGDEPSFLAKWRDLPASQRSHKRSFPELVEACRTDILNEYSKDLFGPDENETVSNLPSQKLKLEKGYGRLPCCEIAAGMCAAQVFRGSRIRENDVYDFLHASAGIPSCVAYFCDRPMEHLLRGKPLELDTHFDSTIRSRPEDLLTYLESIRSDNPK